MRKWNGPVAPIGRSLSGTFVPPFSRRTRPVPAAPLASPLTVPPIRNPGTQTTFTSVTLPELTVPVPFDTVQASLGPLGKSRTVTLYAVPVSRLPGRVKLIGLPPLGKIPRFPAPFSCRTRPALVRPDTVPPTVNTPACETGPPPLPPPPQPERVAIRTAAPSRIFMALS